ncbi:hypothetical protein ACB092_12G180500 [Castanea dentata]
MEAYFPSNGGECEEGLSTTIRHNLASDVKSMVAILDRHAEPRGGKEASLEIDSSSSVNPTAVRRGSLGSSVGEENARGPANLNLSHGQPSYDKDNSSVPTHSGIKSSLGCIGDGVGSSSAFFNSVSKKNLVNGVVEEDEMKFDGRGEIPSTF